MPPILHPWAWIGVAGIPALIVIYLLHNRFRQLEVSSLFLWRKIGRRSAGGSAIKRILPPPIFWLELLIVSLLLLAALAPLWKRWNAVRPLILVLDDSLSMQAAGANGVSTKERAEERVRQEVRSLSPSSIRIIWARRLAVASPVFDAGSLDAALSPWRCLHPAADLEAALAAARGQADRRTQIIVFSDHPPRDPVAAGVRWIATGQPLPNLSLATAIRTGDPTRAEDKILIEVRNHASTPANARLTLKADGALLNESSLAIAPGAKGAVRLACPHTTGAITVTLAKDALNADNAAILLPGSTSPVRVSVHIADAALKRDIDKAVKTGGGILVTEGADLQITDREPTAPLTPGSWLLCIRPGQNPKLQHGPYFMHAGHPLLDGVVLESVVWAAGSGTIPASDRPLVAADTLTVLGESELAEGGRRIDLALDPSRSTLTKTQAWPILFWNLLHWRQQHLPGFDSPQVPCGQWLVFTAPQGGGKATVRFPDGQELPLPISARTRQAGFVPEIPGLYRLTQAGQHYEVFASLGRPEESDLSGCAQTEQGEWDSGADGQSGWSDTAPWWALAAFLLLLWRPKFLGGRDRPNPREAA